MDKVKTDTCTEAVQVKVSLRVKGRLEVWLVDGILL